MFRSSPSQLSANSIPGQLIVLVFLLLLLLSTACQTQTQSQPTSNTSATDETALKRADNDWSIAAGKKDLEKTVSYYADDAIVLPPNTPALTSKDAIHAMWKGLLGAPGFSGSWNATKVEVARSGDLGYVTGTYEFTENDAHGKPMTDKGKYLEVWKKQAEGSWKCVADMFSSNFPPPAPAPEKKAQSK